MAAVINISDLRVEYPSRELGSKTKVAVDGLSLDVQQGQIFGFLGPNGAGKTTTMNVLLGFVEPTAGSATLFGVNVTDKAARQRLGYLPELTYYYKFLTPEELLRFIDGVRAILIVAKIISDRIARLYLSQQRI